MPLVRRGNDSSPTIIIRLTSNPQTHTLTFQSTHLRLPALWAGAMRSMKENLLSPLKWTSACFTSGICCLSRLNNFNLISRCIAARCEPYLLTRKSYRRHPRQGLYLTDNMATNFQASRLEESVRRFVLAAMHAVKSRSTLTLLISLVSTSGQVNIFPPPPSPTVRSRRFSAEQIIARQKEGGAMTVS
jgi:hypothetical protein